MARRKPPPDQQPLSPPDPYPEHAKMYADIRENSAINEFLWWMVMEGLIDTDTMDDLHSHHLAYRGVDRKAYEAEVKHMKQKYSWLYQQFKVDDSGSSRAERAVTKAVTPVVQAALPEPKGGDDGLAFLLARIRGEGHAGKD